MIKTKAERFLGALLCAALALSPALAGKTEEAPCAHAHTATYEVTDGAVTCTQDGSHTEITVCEDCGAELFRERFTDIAPGHAYRSTVTEPSCTEAGKVTWTCVRCGDSFTEKGDPATGHDYQVTARREATEDAEGSVTYTCSRCGDSYTDVLPKTERAEEPAEEPDRAAKNGETVAETDDFRVYTEELRGGKRGFSMPADDGIPLADVLTAMGLTGEITAVEVSDTGLFSLSNENGTWTLTARGAFATDEWISVTVGGVTCEIAVTCDGGVLEGAD